MKSAKSNHRATLKNEHLGKLICTTITRYCPECRDYFNNAKAYASGVGVKTPPWGWYFTKTL